MPSVFFNCKNTIRALSCKESALLCTTQTNQTAAVTGRFDIAYAAFQYVLAESAESLLAVLFACQRQASAGQLPVQ
jgi:hypothetical protein